ncbi:MAG TPA: uracil phosphoribosyltransferase [Bacillota bacterium]|nr:uracil phosphoribosyltransferase [Bacillota bacterium]
MGKIVIFDHPLIQHKVTLLRMTETSTRDFRALAKEVVTLMTFEATRDLPLKDVEIETPMCKTTQKMLEGEDIAIVPILRAGLGFVDGMLSLVPNAKVGHIGLYRDPDTHEPVEYYCKLPSDIDKRVVFVVDPMLATGGSAVAAVDLIKARGAKRIKFLCLIAAPEGMDTLRSAHPDVDIYIAAMDERLNEKAYILPGLGDAGDRLYGTK